MNVFDDEVVLWKSTSVKVDDSNILILMYYYHAFKGDYKNSFYKCNVRIDTVDKWNSLSDNLISYNPGEYFKTKDIELNDDFRLHNTKKHMLRADVSKWLNRRIQNQISYDEFLKSNNESKVKYLLEYKDNELTYDLNDIDNFIKGKWLVSFRDKQFEHRKKYGNIIL